MSAADAPLPEFRPSPDAGGAHSLRKNMLFAVGGMAIFHACQFGVIVLLAKFAADEVLGQVQFALAVSAPIVVFCALELRGAFVADVTHEFTFGTYRTLRGLMMALAAVVLLAVSIGEYVANRDLAYAVIFAGMCAGKLILTLADMGWGLFQKRERLDLMAASAMLRGAAMLVAFGLFVPLFYYLLRRGAIAQDRVPAGAALAIAVYVLASLVMLLWFDRSRIAAQADHDPSWTWAALGRLTRQTFPLGLVGLLLYTCNSLPQLVMESQAGGKAALGRFGALASVTLAGNLLVFQAANAAANRLSNHYRTDLGAFLRLTGKLLGLAGGFGAASLVVTFLLGRWLLRIVFRAEYAGYYDEFVIIMVAQCLSLLTNVFGVMVTQMRLFWLQVPAQIIVLIATAVAAAVLIPGSDNLVRAGAWTLLIRAAVHAALYAACVLIGIVGRPRLCAIGNRGRRDSNPQPPA